MAITPDKDGQDPQSVEHRKSNSSSKPVASGDRGATGKARLQFRKGFYDNEAKDSRRSSSKTERSRHVGEENLQNSTSTEKKTVSTPSESRTVNEVESNSPLPVPRNLGTEFLSVERTAETRHTTSKELSRYKFSAIMFLIVSIFVAFIYYSPPTPLPYCDTNTAKGMEDCRPCPDHGTCSNGELFCDQGYVEFSGKCVKDKKLSLLTRDIRNKLEKILRERAGSCICGSTPNVQREMDRTQLYKETLSLFGDKLPLDESRFHLAFTEAFDSIVNDSSYEFECRQVDNNLWCRSLRPSLSLSCRLRLFALEEWWKMLIALFIVFGTIRLYFWFRSKRWIDRQAKIITEEVYRQLTESAQLTSPLSEKKKFVVTRLRDDLLHDQSLLKWKDKIWEKVVERVNSDSRVLKSRQTVNNLPQLVWEWHDKVVS